jgi:phage terminase large subunit-like protein
MKIIKRSWFKNSRMKKSDIDRIVKDLPKLRYWDFGATADSGDPTAGLKSAYDGEYVYFTRLVHGAFSPKKTLKKHKTTTINDGKETTSKIEKEPAASPKLLLQKIREDPDLKGHRILEDNVRKAGDKITRTFDFQTLAEDDKIKIASDIYDDIVEECVEFDGEEGGEDNIVDTCSGSVRHWLQPQRRRIT